MSTTKYSGFQVDGEVYTSVSSIIKSDKKHFQSRKSAAWASKRKSKSVQLDATSRGIAVHSAIRSFVRTGECDLDPAYFQYFDNVVSLLKQFDLDVWWAEEPVHPELQHLRSGNHSAVWSNKPHKYIGIPDIAGTIGGVPCIVEFKTSDKLIRSNYHPKQFSQYSEWVKYNCAAMQVAAYANAWNQRTSMPISTGIIINTTPTEAQLFIIEKDEMKKRLSSFHKLCKEYKHLYGW